jgi:hypothetical protein
MGTIGHQRDQRPYWGCGDSARTPHLRLEDRTQRLIAEGGIVRDCPDADAVEHWRQALRERAGPDKLTIRTGTTDRDPMHAWAALPDTPAPPQSLDDTRRALDDYLDKADG